MIDKLSLRPLVPIPVEDVNGRATNSGTSLRVKRWRGGGVVLETTEPNNGIIFRLSPSKDAVIQIITRPAAFQSLDEFVLAIDLLVPVSALQGARVIRVDAAIDLPMPIEEVLMGISVTQKLHRRFYDTQGGRITGVYFGKKPEEIVVYNKALHEQKRRRNVQGPLTRIEIQCQQKKVPLRTWNEFAALASSATKVVATMERIHLKTITFSALTGLSHQQTIFLAALRAKAEIIGIQQALSALDPYRNATRRFGHLFKLKDAPIQPTEILRRSLQQFVSGNPQPIAQLQEEKMNFTTLDSHDNQESLTIKDAAALLKIHPDTLRRWADLGKVPFSRHPVNHFRVFDRAQITALAKETRGVKR